MLSIGEKQLRTNKECIQFGITSPNFPPPKAPAQGAFFTIKYVTDEG